MNSLQDFIQNYSVYKDHARVEVFSNVENKQKSYPLISIHYVNPKAPTLLITGGIHGLERIGAQLALSLLDSFHERISWDSTLQKMLETLQVVFIPLANPVGYFETTRSNGAGVDIMRNAPIDAEDPTPYLLGGHCYSNKLPWYRGTSLQKETEFVMKTVKNILTQSDCLISVDLHSGFGFRDQLWFPFANSFKEFTQLSELHLFFELFRKTHPYHVYKIEPQSKVYLTHGDLWDYCYLNYKKENQIYLPLTLEMGSWIWVKKNPLQIFSKTGLFNPIKEHRLNRTLRRHRPFFDFLTHSLASHSVWTKTDPQLKEKIIAEARKLYYEN
ncbi:MAG: zinc carboxypeptidase [Bdellovibrionaceae bacterium]|nr:zinc carboxypeptidase [Pseudobdellovibrionaceae bacterium]